MSASPKLYRKLVNRSKIHLTMDFLDWKLVRYTTWLVVFNHLEKYESQWEGLSHILWKIKFMFETTNQILTISSGFLKYSPFLSIQWFLIRHATISLYLPNFPSKNPKLVGGSEQYELPSGKLTSTLADRVWKTSFHYFYWSFSGSTS